MKTGTLYLVPTPINDMAPIDSDTALKLRTGYEVGDIIAVEDAKVARRKWLLWGLPREAIEGFVLFNEHCQDQMRDELMSMLQAGKNIWLMSDGGLPGFCDPGQEMVAACHKRGIRVSSTYFGNSVSLAYALSGFKGDAFAFLGFPPIETEKRLSFLENIIKEPRPVILLDTPYRMARLLDEMAKIIPAKREAFMATNLNLDDEWCMRGPIQKIALMAPRDKREFVLVIDG